MTDTIEIAAWLIIAAAFVATLVLYAVERTARLADRAEAARQFEALWAALATAPGPGKDVAALTVRIVDLEQRAKGSSGLAETMPAREHVVEVGPASTRAVGVGVYEVTVPRPPRVPVGAGVPKCYSEPPLGARASVTMVGLAPPAAGAWTPTTVAQRPGIDRGPASQRGGA